ncbi:MAG TPA: hypothetical protein DCE80_05525, partial [Ignavibacteriales bacterium]|nr:hypothetical protein [Ignavibacteriales bacterium]
MKWKIMCLLVQLLVSSSSFLQAQTYKIVDTGQEKCYNNFNEITAPSLGEAFYGQDAQYNGNQSSYQDNGDSIITDLVTGLMWQRTIDRNGDGVINTSDKLYYDEARDSTATCRTGGYSDWRLPSIKELYSLIQFSGAEINPNATSTANVYHFLDTTYFKTGFGELSAGERLIDAQYASSTIYKGLTYVGSASGDFTMFGVNFVDGRIKGYPATRIKKYYVRYVRCNNEYGKNKFIKNGNGTITDSATGLMWMKADNGSDVLWGNALSYAEGFEYAGYTDWRLPNAKELHSIVDYTRSPVYTNSAAIDTIFNCTQITNEAGSVDFPCYWTTTTFCSQTPSDGKAGVYISFGRAMGYIAGSGGWVDVHGAGAQRSDPKLGDPAQFPFGHGPQGDAVRIYSYVRLVRGGNVTTDVHQDRFGSAITP